jgi:hypothetical protein
VVSWDLIACLILFFIVIVLAMLSIKKTKVKNELAGRSAGMGKSDLVNRNDLD